MNRLGYILLRIGFDLISILSRAINAFVFSGSTAQTLSARAHIENDWSTHRRVINTIFFWEDDHCKNAWEMEVERARHVLDILRGRSMID